MKIPFVDYSTSYKKIKSEIDKVIQSCLERGDLILRKDVEEFERKLAKFVGTKYAVGVSSGTDALIVALLAAGIKEGDEVITSGYTFWATIEAIYWAKAKPKLTEIKLNDLTIDFEKVYFNSAKAIIPVHIGGQTCDFEALKNFAIKHNLIVIEDACQGLGAKNIGRYSDAACFSFYPAKVLGAYGDAGAIVTNSWKIAEKAKQLRNHCRSISGITSYGFTARLDNIQAAILNVKLKYLPQELKRRKEIARIYNKELKKIKEIVLPKSETWQEYNMRIYKNKKELQNYLKEKEVETLDGDYQFPIQIPINCRIANEQILRLPIWPTLSNKQIYYVCEKIKEFFKK